MIRIVVDAMGSDDFPSRCGGSRSRQPRIRREIILVAMNQIKPVLAAQNPGSLPIRIVHAPEMLTMEDKGEKLALKARHKDSKNSMAIVLTWSREAKRMPLSQPEIPARQ